MRILIPNHFPLQGSGSGIYTLNVAAELTRMGHEVLVIVPEHEKIPPDRYSFDVDTIIFNNGMNGDSAEVDYNFPCFTTHPRSVQTFYELDSRQLADYVNAWRDHLQEATRSFRPDVIHAHHVWVAPYVASETGRPYLITVHGTDLMGYRKGPRYRDMAQAAAERAFFLIAISRQVAADTGSTFDVPVEKIRLIWNGFDVDIFKVMQQVTKSEVLLRFNVDGGHDAPLIAFVGKFTEFKGIDVLLHAAALYERAIPGIQTLLVGQGQLWQEMHRLRDELGLDGVHFVGHQPQAEVARIYNVADVSVVPSRVEPFGLAAVEALACGTPVVATNKGGLPDFIDDEVGALVPVDDHRALAGAIINEVNGRTKNTKGVYASRYALEGFGWPGQVSKMVELYQLALESRDDLQARRNQ